MSEAAVLYDLGTVVRDGTAGENTYLVRNSTTAGSLNYVDGTDTLTWTLNTANNFSYVAGYFNSTTLTNVGDAITLAFNASVTPNGANVFQNTNGALRIGLINSGGTRTASDSDSTGSGTAFNTDTGYGALYRAGVGTIGADNTFQQRESSSGNLMSTDAFNPVSGAALFPTISQSAFTGTFTLKRVATGVELSSTVNGTATQTFVDTASPYTTFDGFGLFAFSGSASPTLTFSTLSVVTTPAVPEPASLGLALVSASALLSRRSRR